MLAKKDLQKGFIYEVASPNFNVAVWTGEKFRGPGVLNGKTKFMEESHYEDGLPFGTCSPIKEISAEAMKEPYDGNNLLVLFKAFSDVLF